MKAAFFLGRIHHALKLWPIAQGLHEKGVEIDVLIADNSINIDPTTEYLHKMTIYDYHHVKDYLVTTNTSAIIDDMTAHAIFDVHMSGLYQHVPPFWLVASVREASECYYGFGYYLQENEPDIVFALHENNFWVRILFYLAQQEGIKTYSLQEGIILNREESDLKKYTTGTKYTDILFSWSEEDKKYYDDAQLIVPVGPSHLDGWMKTLKETSYSTVQANLKRQMGIGASKCVVFAPPRLDLYRGDFSKALDLLIKWTQNRAIKLVLKLHPFQGGIEELKKQLAKYSHVLVNNDADSIPYIIVSDIVITQTSTIALEALALSTPVVEWDADYVGIEQHTNGAILLEGDDLTELIPLFQPIYPPNPLKLADGKSTKRIVDYIMGGQWVK